MVPGDPRGDPPVQGPAFLSPAGGERQTEYVAYVSEQNLLPDDTGEPVRHPQVRHLFGSFENGVYRSRGAPN